MSMFRDRRSAPRRGIPDPRNGERVFLMIADASLEDGGTNDEFFTTLGREVDELGAGEELGGYTPLFMGKPPGFENPNGIHPLVPHLVGTEGLGSSSVALADLRGLNWRCTWETAKFLHEQGMSVILLTDSNVPTEVQQQYIEEEKRRLGSERKPQYWMLRGLDDSDWVLKAVRMKLQKNIERSRQAIPATGAA